MLFINFFFLIIREPPRSTLTDTLFPYTTLFRSLLVVFSTMAGAQNVNPDETGHEPVSTREALQNAKPVTAKHAMVVSAQHLATMAGVDILKRGGNAVDAAVAVGFAEAVVHPCCGNIGGGGFMTIHLKARKSVVEGRSWSVRLDLGDRRINKKKQIN